MIAQLKISIMSEKTRFSDEELEEFRVILENKLQEAESNLKHYIDQLGQRANNSDSKLKGLDDGISTTEAERLSELASRTKKHISHLQNALIRIDNKVYGVCRKTGKLISKDRLRAVPHATLSMEAKTSDN